MKTGNLITLGLIGFGIWYLFGNKAKAQAPITDLPDLTTQTASNDTNVDPAQISATTAVQDPNTYAVKPPLTVAETPSTQQAVTYPTLPPIPQGNRCNISQRCASMNGVSI